VIKPENAELKRNVKAGTVDIKLEGARKREAIHQLFQEA